MQKIYYTSYNTHDTILTNIPSISKDSQVSSTKKNRKEQRKTVVCKPCQRTIIYFCLKLRNCDLCHFKTQLLKDISVILSFVCGSETQAGTESRAYPWLLSVMIAANQRPSTIHKVWLLLSRVNFRCWYICFRCCLHTLWYVTVTKVSQCNLPFRECK